MPEVLVTVAVEQRQIAQRISREVELAFRTNRAQVRAPPEQRNVVYESILKQRLGRMLSKELLPENIHGP